MGAYRFLERNHYLSTQAGLVKEWRDQDVVAFSQLVDFTGVERVRDARQSEGRPKPSYTACIIASIVRALKDHPKRLVYRGLSGYRWVQFEQIDIAVGTEVTEGDLDLAYASIIRNVDQLGVDGIANALVQVASAPSESPQLKRLKRFPAAVVSVLARGTGMHPKLWVQFRGGSCAITSPAKYGVENILVKSCWPLQFAFGKVKARPMVVDDQCVPRQSAMLSPSWHRELTTGAVAARFFEQVVRQLEESIDL
jgi:pyruvate/2-oxoglutarate dehydrogenase complex dihydrolipoamide acyltransferase (E2) component